MSKTAYVTTPIYYPSGHPHLGHAYTTVAADVYARFMRLDGYDTKFLTGTDEHGLKLQQAAAKAGKDTQEFIDELSAKFREVTHFMNASNDDFIRTTEARHKKSAVEMWKRLEENGFIYKGSYSGWYCISDEAYYTEDELEDKDDEKIAPSGHPVEWMEEESYFLKLSAFEKQLTDLYEKTRPDMIRPVSRRNEVLSFIKGGLEDISISRTTFDWGIKVPGDDKHVMYVWIDALTNYLSALDWPNGEDMRYWPALHLVGKDILRFHAVYWPAMLLGAGFKEDELPRIFAHGWWTSGGKKMSKSFGNVIDPQEVTEIYGVDQIRYFMMREISFGSDGDFSEDRLVERINSDLANSLGNLFQRVLSMVQKNCDGKMPSTPENLTDEDSAYILACTEVTGKARKFIQDVKYHDALQVIWDLIYEANRYMDAQQPWILRKEDPKRMEDVLRVLVESFKYISLLTEPFMPESARLMQRQIAWEDKTFADLGGSASTFFGFEEGEELPKPSGIFMRIEKEAA